MRRIDTILQFYDDARQAIAGLIRTLLHAFIIDPLADAAPALAPLVPAISTYRALTGEVGNDLGINNFWLMQAIAISAAIAIEASGMSVSKTALRSYRWGLTANKSEARFPWYVYLAPAICFYSVVIILTLTIEYANILWAIYPLFVLVAVSTYVSLAISDSLLHWEKGKSATKLERTKEKRMLASNKIATSDTSKNDVANAGQLAGQEWPTSEKLAVGDRRAEVERLRLSGMARQEMANELGVSLGTIKNDLRIINNGKVN